MVVELRDRRGDSVILWLLGRGNGLRDNRDISLSSLLVKKNSGWGRYNILRSFWNRLREICVGLVERIRVVVIIFWRTLTTLSGWRWCWRMTRRGNYASDFAACLILFLKLKCSSDLNVSLAGSTSLFLQRLFHFFWLYILDVEGSLILMAWLSFWSLQWLLLLFLICCKWSFLKNGILWFHLMCAAQWHFLRQLLLFINFRTLLPYFANIATLNRLRRLRNLFCHLRNWLLPSLQYCQEIIDEIILNLWFGCTLTLFLWIVLALLQIPKQLIHCACFSSPWLAGVGICLRWFRHRWRIFVFLFTYLRDLMSIGGFYSWYFCFWQRKDKLLQCVCWWRIFYLWHLRFFILLWYLRRVCYGLLSCRVFLSCKGRDYLVWEHGENISRIRSWSRNFMFCHFQAWICWCGLVWRLSWYIWVAYCPSFKISWLWHTFILLLDYNVMRMPRV